MTRLRYAIIGTGAVGGYYGGRLAQAGCDVHFLLHRDYSYVQQNGLVVESIDGDFALPHVNAYDNPAEMPPIDVVIVAIKTTHNHKLAKLLPALKPNGVVLSLQNGLDVERAIAQALTNQFAQQPNQSFNQSPNKNTISAPTILGGLCFICSNKASPGHFRHLDYGHILIGAYDEADQKRSPTAIMTAIADDFVRAKVALEMTDDLPMARWQKLVWNIPYNGLSVVLDATTEEMMADAGVRSLITSLMTEVVAVATAWGERTSPQSNRVLSEAIIPKMLAQTETMTPYQTSMKIDYDQQNPLEIEAILGNPLRTAEALGVFTPKMTMLYQQLSFLNERLIA